MHAILLVLGALGAVVGVALIRAGIPLDEYGNSPLLISGTVAFAGGLIVIALAMVLRTLARIAERLDIQPMPLPPIADVSRIDPSPRPTASSVVPPPVVRPEPEVAMAPDPRAEPVALPAPAVARPPSKSLMFGWLGRGKAAAPVAASRKGVVPDEAGTDPRGADLEPLPPASEIQTTPRAAAPNGAAQPQSAEPSGAAVYKSGVIDGMAYTLYVDGSIEAQLPQGTIRFASVEALQAYLTSRSA